MPDQVQPWTNFPHGLAVQPWGDGVMVSVLNQTTHEAVAAYLGQRAILELFQWLVAAGIVKGEVVEQPPPGDVVPLVIGKKLRENDREDGGDAPSV